MSGRLELAFQVAVLLALMVAPTLFFLALGHLLEYMRADELIDRVQAEASSGTSPIPSPVGAVDAVVEGAPATDGERGVRCRECGATNMRDARYCQQCLRELPEE